MAEDQVLQQKLDDLKIQAMMFDMDIDYETLKLVPKSTPTPDPIWLKRWKEKQSGGDRRPEDYQGLE